MLSINGITFTFNQPSEINGAPIGTLLQVGSNNQKTGYSFQTIYFPTAKPTLAIKTGSDVFVCGDCRCRPSCMASVDDPEEYGRANDMGWRTFRTKLESDPLLPNEIICPYPKVQCVDCGMCDGKDSKFRKNIAVNAHGVRYKVNRYKEYRTQLELPVV